AARRRVLHVVEQLARVVDLGARSRVDFDQIHETALVDLTAGAAYAARRRRHAGFAVERLRENARDRRFSYAARAGEQKGVMHPSGLQRVDERAHDVLLPRQFGEVARAPFASKSEIGHERRLWSSRILNPGGQLYTARTRDRREPSRRVAAHAGTSPAPDMTATVAPFRAWRGSRVVVAEKPT